MGDKERAKVPKRMSTGQQHTTSAFGALCTPLQDKPVTDSNGSLQDGPSTGALPYAHACTVPCDFRCARPQGFSISWVYEFVSRCRDVVVIDIAIIVRGSCAQGKGS